MPKGIISRLTRNYLDLGVKDAITYKFRTHDQDSGSADVQIGWLSEIIIYIVDLRRDSIGNEKRKEVRSDLLKAIVERRRLLDFLSNSERYQDVLEKSGAKDRAYLALYQGEDRGRRRVERKVFHFKIPAEVAAQEYERILEAVAM